VGLGLPAFSSLDMKIAPEDLIQQMKRSGFVLAQEHHFLPYQCFLIFKVY